MIVTLHGAIPVYVIVDTDEEEVTRVIASDEEFFYVGEAVGFSEETDAVRKGVVEAHKLKPVLAYHDDGSPLGFDLQKERDKAHEIAEREMWPGWEWGW
jgi:hypothetical protein